MATQPTPGGDAGSWGTELNEYLSVSLAADGKVKTEALQTDSTAPSADAAVANKKYVDDQITAAVAGAGFYNDNSGEAAVFSAVLGANGTFQDLDLSSVVGSNYALCFFQVRKVSGTDTYYAMKPKGQGVATFARHLAESPASALGGCVAVMLHDAASEYAYMTCATDSAGAIQHGVTTVASRTIEVKLLGYIK